MRVHCGSKARHFWAGQNKWQIKTPARASRLILAVVCGCWLHHFLGARLYRWCGALYSQCCTLVLILPTSGWQAESTPPGVSSMVKIGAHTQDPKILSQSPSSLRPKSHLLYGEDKAAVPSVNWQKRAVATEFLRWPQGGPTPFGQAMGYITDGMTDN